MHAPPGHMLLSVVDNSKVFMSNSLMSWLLLRAVVAVRFMEFLDCAVTRCAESAADNNKIAAVVVAATMSAKK